MKRFVVVCLLTLLPTLAVARTSSCEFSCVITEQRRRSSKIGINVAGTPGRCRGQVLVSSIGPDAQIFAERYYVSEYIRYGRSKRVLKLGVPFATDTCRVEFSPEN